MARRGPGEVIRGPRCGVGSAVLLGAVLLLGACRAFRPAGDSASDRLPEAGMPPRSLRPPSAERPPWLPSLPPDIPRFRVPDDGFRDHLG
jgi:hypothetical protein